MSKVLNPTAYKQRENSMENRKIFYNTHPAIISLEVFDKVQEIRQQWHRRTVAEKNNMFSGLVFCNECKQKLYYSTASYFEKCQDFFICSTHCSNKDKCSGHYIRAVVLEQIVWKHIQEVISVVTRYEAYFPFRNGAKAPYAERGIASAASEAASAGRRYISSTTLWATFPWMSC